MAFLRKEYMPVIMPETDCRQVHAEPPLGDRIDEMNGPTSVFGATIQGAVPNSVFVHRAHLGHTCSLHESRQVQ